MSFQCPHCGDVFAEGVFEGHIANVARKATPAQVAKWLYELEVERRVPSTVDFL